MIHTSEEAKALWCPMVRTARRETFTVHGAPVGGLVPVHDENFIVAGCNTDALGGTRVPASCCCIANKCALWRWHPRSGDHMGYERKGYCGLAGSPAT
jgi:hypothetical protein